MSDGALAGEGSDQQPAKKSAGDEGRQAPGLAIQPVPLPLSLYTSYREFPSLRGVLGLAMAYLRDSFYVLRHGRHAE